MQEPAETHTDGSAELAILEEMRSFLIEQAPFDISHKVFDALRPLRERLKASAGNSIISSSHDNDSVMNEISASSPRGTYECPLKPCEEILLSAMKLAEIRDSCLPTPIESPKDSTGTSPPTYSIGSVTPPNGQNSAASYAPASSPALTPASHTSSQSYTPHSSVGPPKLVTSLTAPLDLASSCVERWLTQLISKPSGEESRYPTLPVDVLRVGATSLAQSAEPVNIDIGDRDESSRTSTQGDNGGDFSTKEEEDEDHDEEEDDDDNSDGKQPDLRGDENKESTTTSDDDSAEFQDAVVYERWMADGNEEGVSATEKSRNDETNQDQGYTRRQRHRADAATSMLGKKSGWVLDAEEQIHQNDDGTFRFL